ncbi:MAG: 4,5-DOPA dioxygenase extradiol [Chloroflexi bacterium HGW-Chloroflexi-5]|jgi:4,5-DOPA dioxygenase extradiol|nr:MAG: 4,5-DOPA dioxygenase extradiol [Chloroflexi bacterium HGW-Chloroflexi-5]
MINRRAPAIFIGHGSPLNAIEENEFNRTWRLIGESIPTPKAILSISSHWQTKKTAITGDQHPQTIHDFWGFPQELFAVEYRAPGSLELVERIQQLLPDVEVDLKWGLDHGTWSVLNPMYPAANIPVVQLSLGQLLDFPAHYALGQALGPLRDEGVIILGSGNVVHNLRESVFRDVAFDWALEYDEMVKQWIAKREDNMIISLNGHGKSAMLSVNSGEHYSPLLYVLGSSDPDEPLQFYCEKVTQGSISMRCVKLG